jgi:hypothetical protein
MRAPRTLRGAFISVASNTPNPPIISFAYNPVTLDRQLSPMMVGGDEGDRSEAVRFTAAPSQTINLEIELDATDALEKGDATATNYGIHPQLAALELLVYPTSQTVTTSQNFLTSGAMEIAPMTAPRTLFVWGPERVLPVRISSFAVKESLFDTKLNPIRATVTVNMRILTYSDLVIGNPDYQQFLVYQKNLETLAGMSGAATYGALGIQSSDVTS